MATFGGLLLVAAAALAAVAGSLMTRSRTPREGVAAPPADARGIAGLVLAALAVAAAATGAGWLSPGGTSTGALAPFVVGAVAVLLPLGLTAGWGLLRDRGRAGTDPAGR